MKKQQFRFIFLVIVSLSLIVQCENAGAQNLISPVGKRFFNPSFSSNGNKILFQGEIAGKSKIFTCDIFGGDMKMVINDNANYFNPVWAPDSSTIIFTSDRNGQYDLYKYNIDNNSIINLTNSTAFDEDYPSYTKNKNNIVFFQAIRDKYFEMLDSYSYKDIHHVISDTAGYNQRRLNREWPVISPDGLYFVTTKRIDRNTDEIWLYSLDKKTKRKITNGHNPIAWTPNGNAIIYNDFDDDDHIISFVNIDGKGKKILFKKYYCYLGDNGINTWGLWDSSGSHICFPITMQSGFMNHNGLVILDTLGNLIRDLREINQVYDYGESVSWSPDSQMITFSKNQGYPNPWNGGIYTIKSDGTELKIIVQDEISYK